MPEVLGPEYGPLAGRTPEEALKLTMNYATDLEKKLGYEDGDDPPVEKPGTLEVVKQMNAASKAPIATEFVGNRAAAKANARAQLADQDPTFDTYDAYIESAMSKMSAEQQVEPANWVEAYWFVWGHAQRIAKQNENKDDINEQGDKDVHPGSKHVEDVIHDSRGNAARGTPRGRQNVADRFELDPADRATKKQFERILGKRISDEEWYRLDNDDINTLEDYEDLQADLKRAG